MTKLTVVIEKMIDEHDRALALLYRAHEQARSGNEDSAYSFMDRAVEATR